MKFVLFLCFVMQVNSGKYRGLEWDDPEKTMFRIPWKHAGKQDFRSEEDAAIFKVKMTHPFFLKSLNLSPVPVKI